LQILKCADAKIRAIIVGTLAATARSARQRGLARKQMNKPLNIRELVRRGPSDRDDVQVIVAVAMRDVSGGCDDLKQRLFEALMEMLLCRALHVDSLEARAAALATVCQIEQEAARPKV
jgi:hypothetical protein